MGPVVYGYQINQKGHAIKINAKPTNLHNDEYYWFHLNASHKKTIEWFEANTDIPPIALEMMLSNNTRPNIVRFSNGYLITLRAVNSSEQSKIEDFNAINIWISNQQIITARNIKILAIEDIITGLDDNDGPNSLGSFLIELIHHLQKRINQVVRDIEEQTEDLEEKILSKDFKDLRLELRVLRKKIVQIRKYIVPQRELLQTLAHEKYDFINSDEMSSLIYYYDKMVRLVEELDITREHILLSQEEIVNTQNDLMNKSMYRISIISGLFLPLGFVTGLLGVNVGGIPGTTNPNSFLILSIISASYLLLSTLYFIWQKRL